MCVEVLSLHSECCEFSVETYDVYKSFTEEALSTIAESLPNGIISLDGSVDLLLFSHLVDSAFIGFASHCLCFIYLFI